jgi:hypothetical protein
VDHESTYSQSMYTMCLYIVIDKIKHYDKLNLTYVFWSHVCQ